MYAPLQTPPLSGDRGNPVFLGGGIRMSGDGCSNGHWCCQDPCGNLSCVDCGSAFCVLPHSWFCDMHGMTESNDC